MAVRWEDRRNTQPIALIFDFDDTITNKDTIELLAQASCRNNHISHEWPCPIWQKVCLEYMKDLQRFDESYYVNKVGGKESRTTPTIELRYREKRNRIEEKSLERVYDNGIFEGFNRKQIREAAEFFLGSGELKLRAGLRELVDAAMARSKDSCIGIVSVNWCKEFIWDVMKISGYGDVATMANQIDPADGEILGFDGKITPYKHIVFRRSGGDSRLVGPEDKAKAMFKLLYDGINADNRGYAGTCHTYVYIGDSLNDLAAMESADVAIIMVKDKDKDHSIIGELRRMHIHAQHISAVPRFSSMPVNFSQGQSTRNAQYYWATDFSEIANTELFFSIPEMEKQIHKESGKPLKEYWQEQDARIHTIYNEVEHEKEVEREAEIQKWREAGLKDYEEKRKRQREADRATKGRLAESERLAQQRLLARREALQEVDNDEELQKLNRHLAALERAKEQEKMETFQRRQGFKRTLEELQAEKRRAHAIGEGNVADSVRSGGTEDSYMSPSDDEDVWTPMAVNDAERRSQTTQREVDPQSEKTDESKQASQERKKMDTTMEDAVCVDTPDKKAGKTEDRMDID